MDGQTGTINGEMGSQATTTTAVPSIEGAELSVRIGPKKVTQSFPSPDKKPEKPTEESAVGNYPGRTTKPFGIDDDPEENDQPADDRTKVESKVKDGQQKEVAESPDEEGELGEEQAGEAFDEFWEQLDEPTRKRLLKSFGKLMADDKSAKEDKGKKFQETTIAMLRLLKLIFACIRLVMFHSSPDGRYSGTDLRLSDDPPEGRSTQDAINRLSKNEKTPEESWKDFKVAVESKENVTFGELMNFVLEQNEVHSGHLKKLKVENEEANGKEMVAVKSIIDTKMIKEEYLAVHLSVGQKFRNLMAPLTRRFSRRKK